MRLFFTLLSLIIVFTINSYATLEPIRISLATAPDLTGKQLKIVVTDMTGTITRATIIKSGIVPTDDNGLLSFVVDESEWTSLVYNANDLVKVVYGTAPEVILSIERLEVIIAKQGLFGATIEESEINSSTTFKFNSITVNPGNLGIGTTTPTQKLDILGNISFSGTLICGVDPGTSGNVLTSAGPGIPTKWTSVLDSHYVGESYGGGIVFFTNQNGRHGLIASISDQSTSCLWYYNSDTSDATPVTYAQFNGTFEGKINTTLINNKYDGVNPYTQLWAAKICAYYTATINGIAYGGWYLPNSNELNLMKGQKVAIGGFADDYYWSSTEYTNGKAYALNFSTADAPKVYKYTNYRVRAIRAF